MLSNQFTKYPEDNSKKKKKIQNEKNLIYWASAGAVLSRLL